MPKNIIDVPIREFHGFRGTAKLTPETNANRRAVNPPRGAQKLLVAVSGSNAVRIGFAPKIEAVWLYDDSEVSWTNLLHPDGAITDGRKTGTVHFTMAAADRLYFGSQDRVGGYRFDIDASIKNDNVTTLTAEYGGHAGFVATAITDGTANGGAPFGQDGNVGITTVPGEGTWVRRSLQELLGTDFDIPAALQDQSLYWLRLVTAAVLDKVEIEQVMSLLRVIADTTGTADAGFFKNGVEYTPEILPDMGSVEFWSQVSGDSTIDFTWIFR